MSTKVIRFEENGPNGLRPMELSPDDFHVMPEEQTLHVYFEDKALGMSAGVWTTTTMQEAFGPYPGDEFILVLEGEFKMLDANGDGVPARQGQCVLFRNGIPVSWMQQGLLKKFYITYLDPRAKTPVLASAKGGVLTMDPGMNLSDADAMIDHPGQRNRILMRNDHGNMEMGLWDTGPMEGDMEPFPWHEFVVVQDGEVTISEPGGVSQTFGSGDVFFIPEGTICQWSVPQYLRKYYCTLDPKIRPGT